MKNSEWIADIGKEMLKQNKRCTSYPIFIVVENQKIYHVSDNIDGRERMSPDMCDLADAGYLCKSCEKISRADREIPDECDDDDCDASFISYRMEKNVPNMRAGFFFTAQACQAHIELNRHHYDSTARSYAISAYHNIELQQVMVHLVGEENEGKL